MTATIRDGDLSDIAVTLDGSEANSLQTCVRITFKDWSFPADTSGMLHVAYDLTLDAPSP